ncbi:unnamed protein product [Callosobruchus maculatus]|uniref:FHA domain-containing protein n=1 Tax=Callosobruchus maculatus TaxID=64391 RepID=A0A653DWA7_CALMS|nr:unnamed protein product [Callosobruchus maculatus]
MVVVSGSWTKNVTSYPAPPAVNVTSSSQDVMSGAVVLHNDMAAKAVLISRFNSHPFQERILTLDQPVKVGRSVARAKPTANNAIFDCKVLSRNHAVLWFDNGKFFLQDTKSSNGTFVNNEKLSAETDSHQLFSGDVVQFGVDVVENNRKVTHGCIIATIKLYLPDGKEAKALGKQGLVPLDDLYRLNQIIQEANQREQCLESKLSALQHVVDETRKSAEESWRAYVGEERLLSRVSALENQLQQAGKQWTEEKVKEELGKLQVENESYQVAAKEALEKLHAEKLEALAKATELERAKATAEQEARIAKEEVVQVHLELESLARKLFVFQVESEEQRLKWEKREQELESKLVSESMKLVDLQLQLQEFNALSIQDFQNLALVENSGGKHIYKDDSKCKEDILAENEISEAALNKSNGIDNHINLTVMKVEENPEFGDHDNAKPDVTTTGVSENMKRLSIKLPEEESNIEELKNDREDSEKEKDTEKSDSSRSNNENEEGEDEDDQVDSKTLKCQFQSMQAELRRRIEALESILETKESYMTELSRCLREEKELSMQRRMEAEQLKQELEQQAKESCNESQQYKDKIDLLTKELDSAQTKLKELDENVKEKELDTSKSSTVSYEELISVEEELVLIKERFAQITEEKLKLQRDLVSMTEQYRMVCNSSHNKYFFYVAPLVFMVLYLLISAMIS